MYVVVGPDCREARPVPVETLSQWVLSRQLPHEAIVILPDGTRTIAGDMNELRMAYQQVWNEDNSRSSSPMDALIPMKNPMALRAYYFGYTTIVPWLGIVMVPFVFIWAKAALALHKEHPEVHGKGHAITGMVFATIGLLINILLWALVVSALLNTRGR